MAINPVKVSANPTLRDLLDLHTVEVMTQLNCHAIATIQSFDSDAQTVTATINYRKTLFEQDPNTEAITQVLVEYPILLDVPLVIMGGGSAALTFPVSQGDECLICFNDRDIDNWVQGSTSGPVNSARLHSYADAIAIVGFPNLSDYDTSRAVLRNGTAMVGVGPSLVKISNASTTLKTALQTLITGILGLTASGSPVVDSTGMVAAATALFGELLE